MDSGQAVNTRKSQPQHDNRRHAIGKRIGITVPECIHQREGYEMALVTANFVIDKKPSNLGEGGSCCTAYAPHWSSRVSPPREGFSPSSSYRLLYQVK